MPPDHILAAFEIGEDAKPLFVRHKDTEGPTGTVVRVRQDTATPQALVHWGTLDGRTVETWHLTPSLDVADYDPTASVWHTDPDPEDQDARPWTRVANLIEATGQKDEELETRPLPPPSISEGWGDTFALTPDPVDSGPTEEG